MSFAVFSDIHGNWEALEAAAAYVKGRGITRFVVLGDTVGYGANPNECLEWALNHAAVNLFGNHERALLDPDLKKEFNPYAREAIEWTAEVLKPELLERIQDLPYSQIKEGLTFVHGSPYQPEKFHYLMNFEDAGPSFRQMQTPVCFVGHTHVPACFCEQKRSMEYLRPGLRKIEKNERVILNPGSIGQPRDRDPRLSFGIYNSDTPSFEIVRLNYDNHKAAGKIRKAGLPSFLADRLL